MHAPVLVPGLPHRPVKQTVGSVEVPGEVHEAVDDLADCAVDEPVQDAMGGMMCFCGKLLSMFVIYIHMHLLIRLLVHSLTPN